MDQKSLDHLLERCLQEVEDTGDIDAVVQRHPEHAEQLRPLLQLASTMRERYAEVPEPQAQLAGGWARLRREARQARRMAAPEQVAATRQEGRSDMRLRLVPTLISITVVVAVWMAGVAGLALAADASVPGGPLYGLDRAMEEVERWVTLNPEAATRLEMRLTEERMDEIQELVRKQDQERLEQALGDYGDAVGALTKRAQAREQLADPGQLAEMNQTLARNEERMRYTFQGADDEEEEDPGVKGSGREGDGWYTGTMTITHPVASSLATQYEISYTQVVSWFADGYGFGEIMHALKTSDSITDTSPSEILALRAELGGWGEVWQELGLIAGGRPEHAGPPDDGEMPDGEDVRGNGDEPGPPDEVGPPDHAGPKDKDKEPGPPSHAGPKDDEKDGDQDRDQKQDRDRDPDGDPDRDQDRDQEMDQDNDAGPPEGVPPDHAGPPGGEGPPGQAGREGRNDGPPNNNGGK
jgi:hypothetical protein